jgi:hypothetical protein
MGVAVILLVYVVGYELFNRSAALFAALIMALCAPLVYYAHNANADVPYLFWALLAIYYFLLLLKDGRLKHYVLFALFGMLSICTKDQAYGLFLLSPLPILWLRRTEAVRAAQPPPRWGRLLFDNRLLMAALVAVGTVVLAQHLLFNFSGLGLTPPLFGACLIGSIYYGLRCPRYALPLLFLAASYYFTFIQVIRTAAPRYVLPIGIMIALFGGQCLAEVWHQGRWEKLRRAAVCLVFGYAALFPIQLDLLFMGGESRYTAERWMQERFRNGAIVETFADHLALAWDYPRFPAWVKVRGSILAAGTQWLPRPTPPQKVRLPNLYAGREAPEYIVLSRYWTTLVAEESAGGRVLRDLYDGRIGYTLVATFETPTLVPLHHLPVNPRIDLFERTATHSSNPASSGAQ